MIGTKKKTPRRPKGKHHKKTSYHPTNDAFRKAGTHNDRHGKMGAREQIAYGKLRQAAGLQVPEPKKTETNAG